MNRRTVTSRKRRRPALSCIRCRTRKIKCDRKSPCDRCIQMKLHDACVYVGDGSPNHVTHSSVGVSLPTPNSTYGSSRSLDGTGYNRREVVSELQHSTSSPSQNPISDLTLRVPNAESAVQGLQERVQTLERLLSSSTSRVPDETRRDAPPPGKPPELRAILSKKRFFGHSHWMYFSTQLYAGNFFHFKPQSFSNGTSKDSPEHAELISLVSTCKDLARAAKAEHPNQMISLSDLRDSVPSRGVSDRLVQLYLSTFESTHRILHIPLFIKEYDQYWKDPQGANHGFVLKMVLVMAIGTCFHEDKVDPGAFVILRSLARQWIFAAQFWLNAPSEKTRKTKLTLTGLQVYCLLLLARQTSALDDSLVWVSAGSLVRIAFSMGLHRDPKHFPKLLPFASEMRRRLWGTILELAVQSSVDSGMPPLISADDFDCEPPSNVDDIDFDDTNQAPLKPKPMYIYTQTSVQITLMKSLITRLEIAKFINDFRGDPSYDEVLKAGADILQACSESSLVLPAYMSSPNAQEGRTPTRFHKDLVDMFIRRFLLALHRPFAIKARKNHRYYYSRKICLESALTFSGYVGDIAAPSADQRDFSRLALLAGGTFKIITCIDAFSSICLELVTQLEEEESSGNPSISNFIRTNPTNTVARLAREPYIEAIKQGRDIMLHRVALGETNIKGHLFFASASAHIIALQAGEPPEPAVFQATMDSARTCTRLLSDRLGLSVDAPNMQENLDLSEPGPELQENFVPGVGDEQDFDFGMGMEQDFASDLMMQDPSMQFNVPDGWLLGWGENDTWL